MAEKIQSRFIQTAAVILFVMAAIRLFGAIGATPEWGQPNSFLLLSNRQSLCVGAGFELALSAYLLVGRNPMMKLSLVAALAGFSLIYQAILWRMGALDFYHCLGGLTDKFCLPPRTVYLTTVAVWIGLFSGSCIFLAKDWVGRRAVHS